ncbi:MAG: response regulator transcription factor [Candidatus Saccharimonadales bacterium]
MEPTQTPPASASSPPAPTPASTPAPAPANPRIDEPGNHPKRILLVEDDEALANVYVTRLQAEGFDVRHVANGEDALAAAGAYRPDLILLDVMMPKVSGFDVLDILRNTPDTANIKIIMLTALSQPSDQERAKSLGADDYLIKSQVVISDVIDRIRHHLGQD